MRRALVAPLVLVLAGVAAAQEWPAGVAEREAIANLNRDAQELEHARKQLETRAQLLFDEAASVRSLTPAERARFRFNPKTGRFYLEVAPSNSAIAPVSSR